METAPSGDAADRSVPAASGRTAAPCWGPAQTQCGPQLLPVPGRYSILAALPKETPAPQTPRCTAGAPGAAMGPCQAGYVNRWRSSRAQRSEDCDSFSRAECENLDSLKHFSVSCDT